MTHNDNDAGVIGCQIPIERPLVWGALDIFFHHVKNSVARQYLVGEFLSIDESCMAGLDPLRKVPGTVLLTPTNQCEK